MEHLWSPIRLPSTVELTKEETSKEKIIEEAYDKCTALEERMRVIEGSNLNDLVKAIEICSVLNVIVLKEF